MQVNDHAIAPGVNQMNRVLLTGVTGYIGQHCAAELLRQGYEVVGTIRSRAKADSTRIAIAKVAPVDRLSFVEVDLLSKTGWVEAMKGCTFVRSESDASIHRKGRRVGQPSDFRCP